MAKIKLFFTLLFLLVFPHGAFALSQTDWLSQLKDGLLQISASPSCTGNNQIGCCMVAQAVESGTPKFWREKDPAKSYACYYTKSQGTTNCTLSPCGLITSAQMPLQWDATFGNFHNADYSRWTLAGGYIDINYFDDQAIKLNGFILSGTGAISMTNPPVAGVPSSDLPLKDMRCAIMGIHLQSEYGGSGGAGLTCYAEGKISGTTFQIPVPLLSQTNDTNLAAFFANQRANGTTVYDMKDMANRTFLETVVGWGGTAKTVIERESTKWGTREVLADGSIRLEFNSDNSDGAAFQTSDDMQAKLLTEVPGLVVNQTGLLTSDGSTTQTQALVGAMRQLNNTISSFNSGAGPGEPVKFQVTTGQTDTHVPGSAQTDATTVKAIGTMTGNNYGDIIALGKPVSAQTALDSVNSANAKFGGTTSRQFEYTGSNAPTTTVSNTPPSSSSTGSSGAGLPTGTAPVLSGGGVGSHASAASMGAGGGLDGISSPLYSSAYDSLSPGGTFGQKIQALVTGDSASGVQAFAGGLHVNAESLTLPKYCFNLVFFTSGHQYCIDTAQYASIFSFIAIFVMLAASYASYRLVMVG